MVSLLLFLFWSGSGWRRPNCGPGVVRLLIGNLTGRRFVIIVNLLRLVGAINGSVVFLFSGFHRFVRSFSAAIIKTRVILDLSGSGSHHQDYDQRRVDCFTQHGASPPQRSPTLLYIAGLLASSGSLAILAAILRASLVPIVARRRARGTAPMAPAVASRRAR